MAITGLPEEQRIREIFSQGEKDKAKELLLKLIEATARKKMFAEAEGLREWLIEEDGLALNDIIKAAEIIEREKEAAINKEHLNTWSDLSNVLDSDDFITLYHCLEHRHFAKGEIIAKQGARQSILYFINNGKVELFCLESGREVQIKILGPGEILGAATFFEASVWTLSARSLGAELSLLKIDRLQALKDDYPALESSLNDFCVRFRISYDSLKKVGRDRRVLERKRLSGRVAMALLDKEGKDTGIGAKGELYDISIGGISFFLRVSQKKNARLLLGRKVRLKLPAPAEKTFTITGVIQAVRSQPVVGNEYSVHIRFARDLTPGELKDLLQAGRELEDS